ncbi:hypothetical protein Csa_010370 [Cucumis sativus]|uniref:Uncharacterized protein n=1 Tax=Cucumis sativus TaxID=3659 RepID=A0A0A0L9U9_CUCSA|nr:hypothetical protein Csa_010370 [Cucumis sativus]
MGAEEEDEDEEEEREGLWREMGEEVIGIFKKVGNTIHLTCMESELGHIAPNIPF